MFITSGLGFRIRKGWRHAGYRVLGWSRRHKSRPWPEWLEDRSLLSPITEYPIPDPNSNYSPHNTDLEEITPGPDGNVWFTDGEHGTIDSVTPSGTITEYPLPPVPNTTALNFTWGITSGPGGSLAYSESGPLELIGTISTSGQVGTPTPIPTTSEFPYPTPAWMTTAPNGSLWWIDLGDYAIGELTPSGQVSEFPIPGEQSFVGYGEAAGNTGIAVGPDGNIWFTINQLSKIGMITPTGVITEYSLPSGVTPEGIVAGPDGNLWITEDLGYIGVMSTEGQILDQYPVPPVQGSPIANEFNGITAGADGNLYFAAAQGYIGQITTGGTVTEIPIPDTIEPQLGTVPYAPCNHIWAGWKHLVHRGERRQR